MAEGQNQLVRPVAHLHPVATLYPDALKNADVFRAGRGQDGLPDWPEWCFLPMAAWFSTVFPTQADAMRNPHQLGDVGRLAALGAWRVTQGIYRFDPALYETLITSTIDGDLPDDVFHRMPEWCVYIETPGLKWFGAQLYGCFAHLEYDVNTGRKELRLLIDAETMLAPIPLHLGHGSLVSAVEKMAHEANRQATMFATSIGPGKQLAQPLANVVQPLISLLLYICTTNGEIGDGSKLPKNPQPKKVGKLPRIFAPDRPTTWDVGVRMGAALRNAYHQAETSGNSGTSSSPRAHVRRAHWHGFRVGPTKTAEGVDIPTVQRKLDVRWMPPITVNVGGDDELPGVIHPVRAK